MAPRPFVVTFLVCATEERAVGRSRGSHVERRLTCRAMFRLVETWVDAGDDGSLDPRSLKSGVNSSSVGWLAVRSCGPADHRDDGSPHVGVGMGRRQQWFAQALYLVRGPDRHQELVEL